MSVNSSLSAGICPKCRRRLTRVPEDMNETRCLECRVQFHNMGSTWCEAEYTGQAQGSLNDAFKKAIQQNHPGGVQGSDKVKRSVADKTRGVRPFGHSRTYKY